MSSDEYKEVLGIITYKGNLNGISVSVVLEAYCIIQKITTDEFNYSHIEGLQEYPKYKALASNCGPLDFGRIKKGLDKLVEKDLEKIKTEMFKDI